MRKKNVSIIGGGIGGLGVAALLARDGYRVHLFEKNPTLGGVCNRFSEEGFTFDTGPSWYMMPEIFENFFGLFGEKIGNFLNLVRLAPSCRMFFDEHPRGIDFFSDFAKDKNAFALLEPGSEERIELYYARARQKYRFVSEHIFRENKETLLDYAKLFFKKGGLGMGLGAVSSMDAEISRVARTPELRAVLQYPAMFLGAGPWRLPALYSFMSYAAFEQGVWYPKGGMYQVVEVLVSLGKKHGVTYHTSAPVESVHVAEGRATGFALEGGKYFAADIVVSDADRFYTEEQLLPARYRDYPKSFWENKEPSYGVLLLFLGIRKKIPALAHHNFFFNRGWKEQFRDIEKGKLSADPSFYIGMRSATDSSCAPSGMENIFVLVPVPASTAVSNDELDRYGEKVMRKMISIVPGLEKGIAFERRWYPQDFAERYHSFRGSALGLAHTFFQTGPFRPPHRSKSVKNLYFVGATTNPGIGMPTCLVSATQVFKEIRAREAM